MVRIDGQYRGNVAASIAIVGSRPHGHHVLIREVIFVPLHDQLMGSTYEVQLVYMEKLFAKKETNTK